MKNKQTETFPAEHLLSAISETHSLTNISTTPEIGIQLQSEF